MKSLIDMWLFLLLVVTEAYHYLHPNILELSCIGHRISVCFSGCFNSGLWEKCRALVSGNRQQISSALFPSF